MPFSTMDVRFDLAGQAEIDRLEQHVRQCLNARLRGFELAVADHCLILRGQTTTYHAKQLAQHAIMSATQRHILANEIEVSKEWNEQPHSGERPSRLLGEALFSSDFQ